MVRRPAFVLGVLDSKRVRVCASSEKSRFRRMVCLTVKLQPLMSDHRKPESSAMRKPVPNMK